MFLGCFFSLSSFSVSIYFSSKITRLVVAAPQAEGKAQHKLTASTFQVLEAGGGGYGCLGQRGPCSHPCGCDGAEGTGPILLPDGGCEVCL